MTTICYKTKEKKFNTNTFLAYYTYKTKEEAQKEVDELNRTKPEKLWNDTKINWEEIENFFVDEQEEMGS